MGFLEKFIPFYPSSTRKPKFDVERALDVRVLPHPSLERFRAANGELILVVQRDLMPVERLLSRFMKVNRKQRIVLDEYGEFMLTRCQEADMRLADVAAAMAERYAMPIEQAKQGVIQLVRDLMLRGFVFLVRDGDGDIQPR